MAFPLWLRTLEAGRRIEIPLRSYPYFESREGKRAQTVQVDKSDDGAIQLGAITDAERAGEG